MWDDLHKGLCSHEQRSIHDGEVENLGRVVDTLHDKIAKIAYMQGTLFHQIQSPWMKHCKKWRPNAGHRWPPHSRFRRVTDLCNHWKRWYPLHMSPAL
jgi:hypothetical protein